MKKILIFSLAYFPHVGGAEIAIKEVTDRISDVEFHLITLRFNRHEEKEERIGNVLVHRIGNGSSYLSKILFVPRAAYFVVHLHKEHSFDAAWAMMSYMVFPLVLLRLCGVRIPYVLNLQDGDPFGRVFNRWFIVPVLPVLIYGFRKASVVVVLSNYLVQWARRMHYRGPVEVIPNGADLKRFSVATAVDIGRGEGDVWLVTSSRLVHKNAIDDVIRALVLLPKHIKFLIIGSGPEEEGLRALSHDLVVEDRIRFHGYVSHTELPGLLRSCDIFIRPSRTEGFGASFAEAMATQLPIIATQEGGIADFLFDAKRNPGKPATGWAVDKDSPTQIADVVREITSHPERADEVTHNALQLVQEKYNWDVIARQFDRVFQKICRPSTMRV
jgi:glycosyltransferase involved in cell wall biosynthesis